MLASTMQFSRNSPTPTIHHTQQQTIREDQPHTPHTKQGAHAASQPNSVPPPETNHTSPPFHEHTAQY